MKMTKQLANLLAKKVVEKLKELNPDNREELSNQFNNEPEIAQLKDLAQKWGEVCDSLGKKWTNHPQFNWYSGDMGGGRNGRHSGYYGVEIPTINFKAPKGLDVDERKISDEILLEGLMDNKQDIEAIVNRMVEKFSSSTSK